MATTPPPTRQHTPPTPLHGAKYDDHEPYSPRRSARISDGVTKRKSAGRMTSPTSFSLKPKHGLGQTTPRRNVSLAETISPPSPNAASKRMTKNPRQTISMLPTPAKTPRQKVLDGKVKLGATARVLFPSRPPSIEDTMPKPSRSRKTRKSNAFALSSFDFDDEEEAGIAIYTDSVERVPEVDEADDNPFIVKKGARKQQRNAANSSSSNTKYGISKEVDEAVDRGEGMVYVFRGKKMFRKFDDLDAQNHRDASPGELSDTEVRHCAGLSSNARLTRSSLKPRLLFPPREPSPTADDSNDDALTDIEEPAPEPVSEPEDIIRTPIKQQRFADVLTPPTTGRKTRPDHLADSPPQAGRSRISPFDAWQRTKPSLAMSAITKRAGEPLEVGQSQRGKRARSEDRIIG